MTDRDFGYNADKGGLMPVPNTHSVGGGRSTSRKNNSMKKVSFLIVLLVLIIGGLGAWWINGISPVDPSLQKTQTFEITEGEGVRQIANELKSQVLIKDPIIFFLLIKQKG